MVDHIRLYVDNQEVPTKFIEFSDGAVNLQVLGSLPKTEQYHLLVSAAVPTPNILQELALYSDYLDRANGGELNRPHEFGVSIHFDYHPYARADRQFLNNEPSCLEAFICSVNCLVPYVNKISTIDPHSGVTKQLWNSWGIEFLEVSQDSAVTATFPQGTTYSVLVAPDKGAVEKARKCLQVVKGIVLITASKVRDKETGRIIKTELPLGATQVVLGQTVLIVDDICDGGGTFLPLADALKAAGAKEVHLYVTHGIFSKGLDVFSGHIDKIFCYQTVGNYVTKEQIWSYNKSVKEIN